MSVAAVATVAAAVPVAATAAALVAARLTVVAVAAVLIAQRTKRSRRKPRRRLRK